ncbi:MAG: DNA-directed RNA polymerase subunit H [Candidatus Altiarchaeota archaeon]
MINNSLVPKHELLKPEEAEAVLAEYNATRDEMPKIKSDDPAISQLSPKEGDIIKIIRNNPLIGESFYYRVVIK